MSASKTKRASELTDGSRRLDFGVVYRENIAPVTAFFARRCGEPQDVADLTSQTFVEALKSAHTYEGRGPVRGWLIAIARRVYARHLADRAAGRGLIDQLGGQLVLSHDEVEDLAARLDARRDGQELLERAARLSDLEREAIELIDLIGLAPKEAARMLGVSANTLRVRLFRAHSQLRKEPR
ncbi:MAG: RNA polymerase sigma factor [Solirubrobacteraceae bacterium]